MKHKMQPPPQIGRDVTPDNLFVLNILYHKQNSDNAVKSSDQINKRKDQDYELMVQRGQIHTASTSNIDYNLKNSLDDVASIQTNSQVDYQAAMTMDAQKPTYVQPSSPVRYSGGLEYEL